MTKRTGWMLIILHVAVALFYLYSRDEYSQSALWSVDASLAALLIVGPLFAGINASDAVALQRGGREYLTEALSAHAQVRLQVGRTVVASLWLFVGQVVSTSLSVAVAARNGSYLHDFSVMLPVTLAFFTIVFFGSLGRMLGYLVPYLPTPPIVALAIYATFIIVPPSGFLYFGLTSESVFEYPHFLVSGWAIIAGATSIMTIGCALTIAVVIHRSFGLVFMTASVIGLGFPLAFSVLTHPGLSHLRDYDMFDAHCDTVTGAGFTFEMCLPRDQKRDAEFLARDLAETLNNARLIDPHFTPAVFNAPEDDRFLAVYPMGQHGRNAGDGAYSVATMMMTCQQSDTEDLSLVDEQITAFDTVYWWLVDGPYGEISQDDAVTSLLALRDCSGQ